MRILIEKPPKKYWDLLTKHFDCDRPKVATTIGDTLYNPDNVPLPDHIIVHEEVHSARQLEYPGGVDAYLQKFIESAQFRFEQELEAFIVQLRFIKKTRGGNAAAAIAPTYAKRLAEDPLYNTGKTGRECLEAMQAYLKKI